MVCNTHDVCRLFMQISRLPVIAGTDINSTVKRTISACLGHQVQLKLNWLGKDGWRCAEGQKRIAFCPTKICEAITSKL